jgi:hypothetical protein
MFGFTHQQLSIHTVETELNIKLVSKAKGAMFKRNNPMRFAITIPKSNSWQSVGTQMG